MLLNDSISIEQLLIDCPDGYEAYRIAKACKRILVIDCNKWCLCCSEESILPCKLPSKVLKTGITIEELNNL